MAATAEKEGVGMEVAMEAAETVVPVGKAVAPVAEVDRDSRSTHDGGCCTNRRRVAFSGLVRPAQEQGTVELLPAAQRSAAQLAEGEA